MPVLFTVMSGTSDEDICTPVRFTSSVKHHTLIDTFVLCVIKDSLHREGAYSMKGKTYTNPALIVLWIWRPKR